MKRRLNQLLLLLNAFWAIPAVWLMRRTRHIFHIRIGTLRSDRIGHFVADAGIQFAKLSEQPMNQIDLYWLPEHTSNKQWEKMLRRNFKIASWVCYLDFWNNILPGGEAHHRPSSETGSRDVEGVIERTNVSMEFLPEENRLGKDWLQSKGWQDGEPFICLLVRDDAFLDSDPLSSNRAVDWGYHSYRNSDIATYVHAIEWLVEQGVWILRMGKIMEKPFPSQHEHIIDYAFCPDRSDLLDIWLFANCTGCISTGSGLDAVSYLYDKPIIYLNYSPLTNLISAHESITAPKHLIWSKHKETLSLRQYLENGYHQTQKYTEAGIEIVDLDSEEILEAVQEFWHRIQGNWHVDKEDIYRQRRFWQIFRTWADYDKSHGWVHPNSFVGTHFLKNIGAAFFE